MRLSFEISDHGGPSSRPEYARLDIVEHDHSERHSSERMLGSIELLPGGAAVVSLGFTAAERHSATGQSFEDLPSALQWTNERWLQRGNVGRAGA